MMKVQRLNLATHLKKYLLNVIMALQSNTSTYIIVVFFLIILFLRWSDIKDIKTSKRNLIIKCNNEIDAVFTMV